MASNPTEVGAVTSTSSHTLFNGIQISVYNYNNEKKQVHLFKYLFNYMNNVLITSLPLFLGLSWWQ